MASKVEIGHRNLKRHKSHKRERVKHNRLPQVWAGWQAVPLAALAVFSAGGQKPEKEGGESVRSGEVLQFHLTPSEVLCW